MERPLAARPCRNTAESPVRDCQVHGFRLERGSMMRPGLPFPDNCKTIQPEVFPLTLIPGAITLECRNLMNGTVRHQLAECMTSSRKVWSGHASFSSMPGERTNLMGENSRNWRAWISSAADAEVIPVLHLGLGAGSPILNPAADCTPRQRLRAPGDGCCQVRCRLPHRRSVP